MMPSVLRLTWPFLGTDPTLHTYKDIWRGVGRQGDREGVWAGP